ncbi:hypothetical protein A1O1_00353, partial [Capronia coronata CBS 617.96]
GRGEPVLLREDDVDEVLKRPRKKYITVLEAGQVMGRTGAQGKLRSICVRDLDGNLIE